MRCSRFALLLCTASCFLFQLNLIRLNAEEVSQDAAPESTQQASTGNFRAGAVAVDISPESFPVRIAGGFLEGQTGQLSDKLFARAIVMDDGTSKLVMVVVDTCMMTQKLIDDAKHRASSATGIPVTQMMVSATHTHAAPAAMACLGTRQDETYAAQLPGKIANAIIAAHDNLQPARIGWAAIDDWEHTHNRRWIRKPEHNIVDPFGGATGRAHMHPGYESSTVIGPSGPVDPTLTVVALQTTAGQPLAVLANYSQHYFGAAAVSADYYGLFCKHVASLLGQPGEGNGPFVVALSQGTSGDLMWMDYGVPAKSISMERYAHAVARYAETALGKIEYRDFASIGIVEQDITLKYRTPDDQRLRWAKPIAAQIEDDRPKTMTEVYAMEAMILHQRQQANVKVQSIRIGDLTIATLPNEVYALTGLKLRGRSPGQTHFNIELANGAVGYIPPPEQHVLGGYTTWPARTAGLEVAAEPQIVETLIGGLEKVTGMARQVMRDQHGVYAKAILEAGPISYWRMNDEDGEMARNSVPDGPPARLTPGYALYLPGVGSGSGIGDQEQLISGNFSGPKQINRAIHFAGGELIGQAPGVAADYSVVLWYWLGEASGASQRSGSLFMGPSGENVMVQQGPDHLVNLVCGEAKTTPQWAANQWNMAVISKTGAQIHVTMNGASEPALQTSFELADQGSTEVRLGVGLQGKLDEIAVFDRQLTAEEINHFWELSGIEQKRVRQAAERERLARKAAANIEPLVLPIGYAKVVQSLKPLIASPLATAPPQLERSGNVSFTDNTFARFSAGRLAGKGLASAPAYSVSFWFHNELETHVRPVTAYIFSRGEPGDALAPGDHVGIGGSYRGDLTGKLIFFNGNTSNQVVAGRSTIEPRSWNHAVMIRDGERVQVFLNGDPLAEIDTTIEVTTRSDEYFFGARSDFFAPLRGNVAHLALFDRALDAAEIYQLNAAAQDAISNAETASDNAKGPTRKDEPAQGAPAPDSQPLSIEQSVERLHVPRGFRAEVVAAEPAVVDPVAFDWDQAGRLWVAEMSDYPLGLDGRGKPGGRVRVLEDRDGDGKYETNQIFADGLRFPNGILTWREGVLVTAAPEILYLADTDGDGRADIQEVLFSGFNEGNQQLRMNHLRWGLDNWVYCANGGHHANHGLGTQVTSHRTGASHTLGSRDFRFKPDTGELELESGPSQYGRNRNAWGHWFGTQNANPLWHYVLSDRYLGRNPHVPTVTPLNHLVGPGSPKVYPISELQKRYHSFEQSGRFTSACSGMIYNDALLFGSDALAHAFTCEPFHNLIQHNVLIDDGVSYRARRPLAEGAHDFFASEDRWSRPVMVRTGPDGGLWVADMYRYMIEHPDWLPKEGKAELVPHYRLGDQHGRIYRVVPSGGGERQSWSLEQATTPELVAALQSANDWQRDKAQQLLIWNHDPSSVPLLEALVATSRRPETRLQAIWVLAGMDALEQDTLLTALADPHPRVRENAIRVAENYPSVTVQAAACQLAHAPDAKVCLQLALTLGEWRTPLASNALVTLASRFPDDSFMVAAVMSSALSHGGGFVSGVTQSGPQVIAAYRLPLLRQSLAANDQDSLAALLRGALGPKEEAPWPDLDAFLLLLQQLGVDLHALSAMDPQGPLALQVARVDQLLVAAERLANNEDQPVAFRLSAATLLCRVDKSRSAGVRLLAAWLRPQIDPARQAHVIETLAQSGDPTVPEVFAEVWSELSPEIRTLALQAWLSRNAWIHDLLDRIESQMMPVASLDLTQRNRLLQHPDKSTAARATQLLESSRLSTRQEVINKYRGALQLTGKPSAGQLVYRRTCANCHQRGDEGHNVGPNLATVAAHSNEKLLNNIFDPNIDIQPGYQAYTCLLTSGEVLAGIIAGETANSITIKQANGLARTVSRAEIEHLQNTNRSFMPEGLETELTPQDFADLLTYLRQPVAEN
ncbi:neutral/alkaline non-lysosomal ceramidase N-terminal domain-containing protein [Planctomycetaceae bacterium SH139]